ncbi:MAG: Thioredoxin reductase [Candidatus Dependentiae bacterium ADurb.Bin331]|nr:MAG: Thioredoxin reductase [Candidatus Dependentiae bacterium ADurb.Bin331]
MMLNRSNIVVIIITAFLIVGATIGVWQWQQHKMSRSISKIENVKNIVPVVVIGSGPAGLSAALYTARAKFKTIIFTGAQPGGDLTGVREIENWPGKEKLTGIHAVDDLTAQAQHFGAEIINDTVKTINTDKWPFQITTEDGKTINALAVVIAAGGTAKKLKVPGALEYWGKGVGSCTICEAPFQKGKDVTVIGGGDTSADRALQLSAYANNVYLVVRESRLTACGTVQDYLKKAQNIHILLNTQLLEIKGNDDGVSGMVTKDVKTGKETETPIKALYFAIGYQPNSEWLKSSVHTDKEGFIVVEQYSQKTNIPGIYAAGNVALSDKAYGKAGVATGSGVKAGMDAIEFLENIGFVPEVAEKMEDQFFIDEHAQTPIKGITTKEELTRTVKENPRKLVLVDFYGEYCPMCRKMMPTLQSLAKDEAQSLVILKAEQTKSTVLTKEFNVTSVPCLFLLKNGKKIWECKDTIEANVLEKTVKSYCSIGNGE